MASREEELFFFDEKEHGVKRKMDINIRIDSAPLVKLIYRVQKKNIGDA